MLLAVKGATFLQEIGASGQVTIVGIILLAAFVNLLVGSASAKWALLAPIFVPMLMAARALAGADPGGLPRRRLDDQHHHAADALLPAGGGLLPALREEDRHRHGDVSMMLPYSVYLLITWTIFLMSTGCSASRWVSRAATSTPEGSTMRLTMILMIASLLAALPLAADPVGWRMGGDGRYLDADAPAEWSPTKNVLWKTKMSSWSNASPVLLEEQGLVIVLSEPDEIVAVKTDGGEIAWTASTSDIVADRPSAHDANGWTSATPVADGDHIWTLFGTGVASAYTTGGERVWARLVQKPEHRWGNSAAPALGGGNLIVHVVDVFALDPKTGKEVWRAESEPRWGSPVVTHIGGVDVVITTAGDVFRADNGEEVARGIGGLKFAVPVVQDGIVYFIEKEATAVRLPDTLDGEFVELWKSRVKGSRHYASSLVHDGLIYAISREQDFTILDATTGEVLDERSFDLYDGGSNGAYSSITLAGDKLFLGTENGASVVFKPGKTYQEIARNEVEGYRSTPIFDGDRMYLRAFDYLYCFSAAASSSAN